MSSRFIAIDFETANASLASICQIGAAVFVDGQIVDQWETLINPEDWFDGVNISIHGIDEGMVRHAPTLPDLVPSLERQLCDQILVCHTHFDRVALFQAYARYGLQPFECTWLDSARVTRRCWEQFSRSGYGLFDICEFLSIQYRPHNALEDARAAGIILLRAMEETGLDLDGWVHRVTQPISSFDNSPVITQDGNPQGHLYGEEVVFTGTLTIRRVEAASLASRIGCNVSQTVRKTTTMLVVGDQDVTRLGGHAKSAKHRKAEAAIEAGQSIRILRETDFLRLFSIGNDTPLPDTHASGLNGRLGA